MVMRKFYDGRKRKKLKECVSQRRNIDDFLYDTYYEEEDDEQGKADGETQNIYF